ncbi:MAG: DUF5668 domain-containing protein [Chloroflexota bacterium]
MKRFDLGVAFGLLLIAVGTLLLLQTLNILTFDWSLLWALLFAFGGAVFLSVSVRQREQWWALIPGFTLLSLGALIGLSALVPGAGGGWGGALFLGGIGLAFVTILLTQRKQWWALIPGGALLTLALVAGLSEVLSGITVGGVFFLGLAATFGLLYRIPTPQGRQTWAVYPATVLGLMGLIIVAAGTDLLVYLLAVALIVGGLALMLRAVRAR